MDKQYELVGGPLDGATETHDKDCPPCRIVRNDHHYSLGCDFYHHHGHKSQQPAILRDIKEQE